MTSVQPLRHNLVDLNIIGLDMEDGYAGVTVGGGEEDLRPLEIAPRVLLRCDDGYIVGAAPVRCTAVRLKQNKTNIINLL